MKERKQTFPIDKEISLLDSIFEFKKDISKKSIKSFIKNKMVKVNGNITTNSSYVLNKNDVVEI
jgi:RNA-binding protein YlmH